MSDLFAVAPWLETLRDTSAVIAALAVSLVSVSAAVKLPFISRPLKWIGRTFFANPLEAWLTRFLNDHQGPIHDTINATAEKVEAIDTQVQGMDGRLEAIEHEVLPNDGSSLRDAVSRNEDRCSKIDSELRELIATLNAPRPQGFPLGPW